MGNEQQVGGIINWNQTHNKAIAMLKKIGLDIHAESKVRDLGLGKQQLIKIAEALTKNVKLLILNEPTAALNDEDSEHLLDLLVELKDNGISCILISHKLNKIVRVAQEITVLRDGKTIDIKDATEDTIIKLMVGRELTDRYPHRNSTIGEVCFEVNNCNVFDLLDSDR